MIQSQLFETKLNSKHFLFASRNIYNSKVAFYNKVYRDLYN